MPKGGCNINSHKVSSVIAGTSGTAGDKCEEEHGGSFSCNNKSSSCHQGLAGDADGDGLIDSLDYDSPYYFLYDSDGDGKINGVDDDDNDDGLLNVNDPEHPQYDPCLTDQDGDGIADILDPDPLSPQNLEVRVISVDYDENGIAVRWGIETSDGEIFYVGDTEYTQADYELAAENGYYPTITIGGSFSAYSTTLSTLGLSTDGNSTVKNTGSVDSWTPIIGSDNSGATIVGSGSVSSDNYGSTTGSGSVSSGSSSGTTSGDIADGEQTGTNAESEDTETELAAKMVDNTAEAANSLSDIVAEQLAVVDNTAETVSNLSDISNKQDAVVDNTKVAGDALSQISAYQAKLLDAVNNIQVEMLKDDDGTSGTGNTDLEEYQSDRDAAWNTTANEAQSSFEGTDVSDYYNDTKFNGTLESGTDYNDAQELEELSWFTDFFSDNPLKTALNSSGFELTDSACELTLTIDGMGTHELSLCEFSAGFETAGNLLLSITTLFSLFIIARG